MFSFLFGPKYDDGELIVRVDEAIANEPTLNASDLEPVVQEGVVTLRGTVATQMAKRRAVETVRRELSASGLKYEEVVDEIKVS